MARLVQIPAKTGAKITTKIGFARFIQLIGSSNPNKLRSVKSLAKIVRDPPDWSKPDQKAAAPMNKKNSNNKFFFSDGFNPANKNKYKKYNIGYCYIIPQNNDLGYSQRVLIGISNIWQFLY